MEIYFQLVNDAESSQKGLLRSLENEPYLGFDVETTDLDPYKGRAAAGAVVATARIPRLSTCKPFGRGSGRLVRKSAELAPLRDLLALKEANEDRT